MCAEDIPGCEGACVLETLTDDPVAFIGTLAEWGIPLDNTLLDILQTWFPMPVGLPVGVTPSNFYSFIENYERYWRGQPFDAAGCAAEVDERILAPLQAAQEMLDRQPYLTRMTSSMSASEMTVDPYFSFNPDLPDVARARTAVLTIDCTTETEENAPRFWTFSDGSTLVDVPLALRDELDFGPTDEIAAETVELLGRSGPPIVVTDRGAEIDALAASRQAALDALFLPPGETGGSPVDTDTLDTDAVLPIETDTDPVVETDTLPPIETDTDPVVETDTVETLPPVETDTDPAVETDTVPPVETDTTPPAETDTTPEETDTTPVETDTTPEETDTVPTTDTDPVDGPKDADPVDPTGCGGCSHQSPPSAIAGVLLLALRRRRS